MPLTQADMDFFTRYQYEQSNFDKPIPAHDYLRHLRPTAPRNGGSWRLPVALARTVSVGRYRRHFFPWAPPGDLPPLTHSWSTWQEFVDRAVVCRRRRLGVNPNNTNKDEAE